MAADIEVYDDSHDDDNTTFENWLKELNDGAEDDEDTNNSTPEVTDPSLTVHPEPEKEDEQGEPEDTSATPPQESDSDKPWLTEENAKNAERRRQEQFNKQLQATPEYQLAKNLERMYGRDIQTLLNEANEAQLQQQAQQENVPVEVLRQQQQQNQRIQYLEEQLSMNNFTQWNEQIAQEMRVLQKEYPFLTEDDLGNAKGYLLGTLKSVDVPLRQAVNALYADRIIEHVRSSERNNTLANAAGRSTKPNLQPSKGSNQQVQTLSEAEKYAAKALGISEEDYIKNRI